MNRIEIKEKSKKITKENFKNIWKGYLIVLGISFLCSLVISIFFEKESIFYYSLSLLTSFFTSTLTAGFYFYILKIVRNKNIVKEDLFKFIGNVLPIVTISLLTTIFVFLFSLLFIIPGIIVALSYAMSLYIYIDNPNKTPMECLSQSKIMMNGYKMDYLVFCLSFLGWILLGLLTFGIALIWAIPYINVAQALYYDELKKRKEKN